MENGLMDSVDYKDQYVCVVGLGYVGLTLAAAMADVGFNVLGVEIRDDVLSLLDKGKPHFHEPGLEDRLKQVISSGTLTFSKDIPSGWNGAVFIITVGTPLDNNGNSRLDMIERVSRQVAQNLKDDDLVIMRSTVKIGSTRKIVMPILNEAKCKYELAFCPERTLEGKALIELRSLPQIVGGLTYGASVRASQLFQHLTPTVVKVEDVETAEMIKLIDNAQRDVAFAYANEVAQACDAVGISAAEVIRAGKLGYARTNLPMPGPVGGPCLEKDSYILAESLREMGVEPSITMSARNLNEKQPDDIIKYLRKITSSFVGFPDNPKITLMGIAFKGQPETNDLRGTMAKPILNALKEIFSNASFFGYDAIVEDSEIRNFGLEPLFTLEQAFNEANLVLIINNHPAFITMSVNVLAEKMAQPGLIYDFWNCFNASDLHLPVGTGYMALGSHGRAKLPEEGI